MQEIGQFSCQQPSGREAVSLGNNQKIPCSMALTTCSHIYLELQFNIYVRFCHSVNVLKSPKLRLTHQTFTLGLFSPWFHSWKRCPETQEQTPVPTSPPATADNCYEQLHWLRRSRYCSEHSFASVILSISTNDLSFFNLSSYVSLLEWYQLLCQLAINYILSELLSISIMKYRCECDTPLIQNKQTTFSIVLRD